MMYAMAKTLNLRNLPEELLKKLKVEAATRGITLRAFVIELMENYTRKNKK